MITKNYLKRWKSIRKILNTINGLVTLKYSILIGIIGGLLDLVAFSSLFPLLIYIIYPDAVEKISYLDFIFTKLEIEKAPILLVTTILLIAIVLKNLISLYFTKKQLSATYGVATKVGSVLIHDYFRIDFEEYSNKNSSEVSKIIFQAPLSFSHNVFRSLQAILSESIVFLFISFFLAIASPKAFGISSLFIGFLSLFIWVFIRKKAAVLDQNFKQIFTEVNKMLYDTVDNYLPIRLYKKTNYFIDLFLNRYQFYNQFFSNSEFYKVISSKTFEIFGVIAFSVIISLVHFNVFDKEQIVFAITVFSIALYRMVPITNKILTHAANVRSNYHIVDLIEKNIDLIPRGDVNQIGIDFEDKMVLSNVSFFFKDETFGEKKILKNLDLEIKKGDWIGISGKSGSGKTTLMKILLGILSPVEGEFKIDAISFTNNHQEAWFEKIGYLNQHPNILDYSLIENICFGKPVNNENIKRALSLLEKVGLKEWCEAQEKGIHTPLGDKGVKISGGQAKRICLVRTLFKKPDVLFLDEFTNETDELSNATLLNELKELSESGCTIVQISHQDDSLIYCNHRYKLHNGNLRISK